MAARTCAVDACVRDDIYGHGWCYAHYQAWRKHGDPLINKREGQPAQNRKDKPGYTAAHARVRRVRGSASDHICVDCGGPAREWSYNHQAEEELVEEQRNGSMLTYTTDLDCYEPRCAKCHDVFDLAHKSGA